MTVSDDSQRPQETLSWSRIFLFALMTRVIVIGAGIVLGISGAARPFIDHEEALHLKQDPRNAHQLTALTQGSRRWIEPWYRFDAIWYAEISDQGYVYEPGRPSSVAFLPLLPLAMRTGSALGIDRFWAGLIIPNFAFAVGLVFFARCAHALTGSVAKSWIACFYLVCYPWSFFFSAPYQESLGFALGAGALWAWLSRRPLPSGLLAAPASAARIGNVGFSAGLIAEWMLDRIRGRPPRNSAWLVAGAGFVGIGLYYLFCYWQFGDAFVQFKAQAAWGRGRPGFQGILFVLTGLFRNSVTIGEVFDYVIMVTFCLLGIGAWRKYGVLTATMILTPLLMVLVSGSPMSMARLVMVGFPAFIIAGDWLFNKRVCLGLCLFGLALQGFYIYRFVNWHFVR